MVVWANTHDAVEQITYDAVDKNVHGGVGGSTCNMVVCAAVVHGGVGSSCAACIAADIQHQAQHMWP